VNNEIVRAWKPVVLALFEELSWPGRLRKTPFNTVGVLAQFLIGQLRDRVNGTIKYENWMGVAQDHVQRRALLQR
jgi:hypothetical protein